MEAREHVRSEELLELKSGRKKKKKNAPPLDEAHFCLRSSARPEEDVGRISLVVRGRRGGREGGATYPSDRCPNSPVR